MRVRKPCATSSGPGPRATCRRCSRWSPTTWSPSPASSRSSSVAPTTAATASPRPFASSPGAGSASSRSWRTRARRATASWPSCASSSTRAGPRPTRTSPSSARSAAGRSPRSSGTTRAPCATISVELLVTDRLPEAGPSLEVVFFDDARFGAAGDGGPREPHRHDYHELIWTRSGEGRHLIDGEPTPVAPGTLTLIGRGQVHVFERASGLTGAVVRFGDELLAGGPGARADPRWMLGAAGSHTVSVPASEAPRLESVIESLAAESRRPPDSCSVDLERHLLAVLLLWVERWYDAARTDLREPDDADVQLYRRFVDLLERDFARHHDARHYADALGVPPAALSRALSHATGRATKELIGDRVMLEAARLLRFSALTIGEIAFRAGFGDQLYFSRAFKRRYGESPTAYRERLRGKSMDP